MNSRLLNTIRAAEKAVNRLVSECRKDGPVYADSPKAAAQVSRTGKWLLNAISALRQTAGPEASTPTG
jgi:hypothetical protein